MKLIIIMTVLMISIFYSMNHYFLEKRKRQINVQAHQSISLMKTHIENLLRNNESIKYTMAASENASFECITNSSLYCSYQAETTEFHLYDANNKKVTGTSVVGFTKRGARCEVTEPGCLFSYHMTWRPTCSIDAVCLDPKLEFKGELIYREERDSNRLIIDTARYKIAFVRSPPP